MEIWRNSTCNIIYAIGGNKSMLKELMENEMFRNGVAVGISLYQNAVVSAGKRKEHLLIDGEFYYVQNGRERLQEVIEKMCE